MATCIIHAIRYESKQRDNIKMILKELLQQGDCNMQDSDMRDAFMYLAMRNHINTFYYILDTLRKERGSLDSIKAKQSIDREGKSFVHYIVKPIEFGSYENAELLKEALDVGFAYDIRDKSGFTPYDYACKQ